jgi:hypothetical protein
MHICMYVCMYVCMYLCIYTHAYISMYVCMYVYCIYAYMYACMYVYIYVYMYVSISVNLSLYNFSQLGFICTVSVTLSAGASESVVDHPLVDPQNALSTWLNRSTNFCQLCLRRF